MKTQYLILGVAPALLLAACGHKDNTDTTATADNSGTQTSDANMAGGGTVAGGTMAGDSTANATAPQGATSGQQFADTFAASDQYEIQAGKLAQQKAQSKALKDFGKMMVEQHSRSTEKLKAAAAKASPAITPAPALTAEQQSNLAALQGADGAAFDTTYKTQQVQAHEKALALVQGYAGTGDVAPLKAFAGEAEKIVQAHLTKIKGM